MNVLVTSVSRKVPFLKAVRKACEKTKTPYRLYGADSSREAIGKYFVDHFWQMPPLERLAISELVHFCKKHGIGAIIPTRDGELLYFAQHKAELQRNGIAVLVSDAEGIEICLSKLLFYKIGSDLNYPVIETSEELSNIDSQSFVVKENFGAGSGNIAVGVNREAAVLQTDKLEHPVFQPYIDGQEYSVDMFVDQDGTVKGTVARKRELVVQGESQITTTVRNQKLEEMCSNFIHDLRLYGHVMMQVIIDKVGKFHIVECNCRFGGASTLSLAAGLDSFYWFLLEASGESLEKVSFKRSIMEKQLIRHAEDLILEREG